jgi:origin recognition complex subunit 3
VLLTGVNQTDHFKQFDSLSLKIFNNCPSIVTVLKSRDCPTLKSAIETLVHGLIYNKNQIGDTEHSDEESLDVKLKKKQLTLSVLVAWFNNNFKNSRPKLVIMLADFEQFNPVVMQELIEILCAYTSRLPLVMILGIATAFKTLHNVLPFNITSKITANVFQAESATSMLNRILNEIILTHHCPFFLSGKSFNVLVDIFLFYDYSLHSFIQGFKVFMMEQFMTRCFSTIYSPEGKMYDGLINLMSHGDCEAIRRTCMSFRRFVEMQTDPQKKIDLIKNDDEVRKLLTTQKLRIYRYFFSFFCCLRMLAVLIEDLPRNNLGTLPRELYPSCASEEIVKNEEFKECFKYLRFTAKDQFLVKLNKIIKIVETSLEDSTLSAAAKAKFVKIYEKLQEHCGKISNAGMSPVKIDRQPKSSSVAAIKNAGVMNRQQMMEKLKESAQTQAPRQVIEYEEVLIECLDYLHKVFESHLIPFHKGPTFIELFVFSDYSSVRRQIVGAPRGAIHNALSNPHHYLQCNCCEQLKDNELILPTMPDICIAYKLHLECNKFINLFDWLQAFSMVVDDQEDEESIKPEIQ